MSSQFAQFIESIGRPRIAVVGDAVLDEYVWGQVERVSPEAPIPVLHVARRESRGGGAGSVAVNLARLEADVSFFCVCGDDEGGAKLRGLLEREGIDLAGIVCESGRPTTVKTRHVGFVQHANRAAQQLLRVDDEVRRPLESATVRQVVAAFAERAGELDAVLISDYKKGLIDVGLLEELRRCAPVGLPFLVDPCERDDYSLYRGCTLICPNRYEAQTASGIECQDVAGCQRAAAVLTRDLDVGAVALTMDADGVWLHESSGAARHFPTRARVVTDVTGAGDMVLSMLGLVTAAGGSLDQAVHLANVAAGLEIRRLGATALSRGEIAAEILYEGRPEAGKIRSLPDVVRAADSVRIEGRTVVFTNGCFDLFHAGHHHLICGAAAEGDVLVVGVNSDASVRRIKGAGRPRIPEQDRMVMIAGLEVVDLVVRFEEDTPMTVLAALRPDVLVKGEQYRDGLVVGAEFVESYGGRVAFVSHLAGFSTTALLDGKPRDADDDRDSPRRPGREVAGSS